MGTQALLIFFGVTVQLCNVSGKNSFYEYYYSRYHKSHSTTTESTLSSISDIFSSLEHDKEFSVTDYIPWEKAKDRTSTSDDNSLQNNLYEVTDDSSLENHKYEPTGYPINDGYNTDYSSLRIGVIVGGAVIFLCVFCCLFCCIRHFCCTRKVRRGFITASQLESAREVAPQERTRIYQPPAFQQPYPTQCYVERGQFLPQHQLQPMQQFPPVQPQYSPTAPMQSHNPPEAPPPYEFPEKF